MVVAERMVQKLKNTDKLDDKHRKEGFGFGNSSGSFNESTFKYRLEKLFGKTKFRKGEQDYPRDPEDGEKLHALLIRL